MKLNMIYSMIFLTAALAGHLMFPVAAADSQHALTCNVTQLPDGSFRYQLSRPSNSTQCTTCWEDRNKTVIARDFKSDKELVQNLTDQFIILKRCKDYLHYTKECKVWEDAHCEANCSDLLSGLRNSPLNTVNSTLICITKSLCMTHLTFGLSVTGILFLLGFFVVLYLHKWRGRRCTASGASYTPAEMQDQMREMEVIKKDNIV